MANLLSTNEILDQYIKDMHNVAEPQYTMDALQKAVPLDTKQRIVVGLILTHLASTDLHLHGAITQRTPAGCNYISKAFTQIQFISDDNWDAVESHL